MTNVLGGIGQRGSGWHWSKRFWVALVKEVLGGTDQRGSWVALVKEVLGGTDQRGKFY